MVIAINVRTLSGNTSSRQFLENCFIEMATKQPLHQFIFISNNPLLTMINGVQNLQTIILSQQTKSPLIWKLWYNYQLPALLKKIKADVLICGDAVSSLRCKLPQVLFINELSFLKVPTSYPANVATFIHKNAAAFIAKAQLLLTSSQCLKNELVEKFSIDADKIAVVFAGTNKKYQPISWAEKEKVKQKYTAGKEYFLYSGPLNQAENLILLLKAFSLFKKRQKTNMQLVIANAYGDKSDEFINSLQTYKLRQEVKLLDHIDENELYEITASAYAYIDAGEAGSDLYRLLNVMQCGVPVLVNRSSEKKEWFQEAALYADVKIAEEIALQMMLLFTNENKRNEIIEKAILRAAQFCWEDTTNVVWQKIRQIVA